jgi:predicted CXXCH cytochrome family protein
MRSSRAAVGLLSIAFALLAVGAATQRSAAAAAPAPPLTSGPAQQSSNEACLICHEKPGQTKTLPSGQELYITIDGQAFDDSVHGQHALECITCHPDHEGFPHPEVTEQTARGYSLDHYTVCADCHADKYDQTLDSVHQKALAGGNPNAAICTDCHNPHATVDPRTQPRSDIPKTCAKCHSAIYEQYLGSVHGAALTDENNPDVPTCIDCHGVHNVQGPTTGPFRLFSPTICAKCHADPQLMAKYGLSTDILQTYVADFHGTTVLLFEKIAPDQQTNKPVCVDCHGVHNILPPTDPNSSVMKQNLLVTCQRCHPDATANFPSAWLGHYPPDRLHSPLVYYVNLFYRIFIPVVLGGMAVFVLSDFVRRMLNRRRQRREARHE